MKCLLCCTPMIGYDDVVQETVRIDWQRCPKCGAVAEIHLHPRDGYVTKAIWHREAAQAGEVAE